MTAIARILKLETQRNLKSENRGEELVLLTPLVLFFLEKAVAT